MKILGIDIDTDRKSYERIIDKVGKENTLIIKYHWLFLFFPILLFVIYLFIGKYFTTFILGNVSTLNIFALILNISYTIIIIFTLSYSYYIVKYVLKEFPINKLTNIHLKVSSIFNIIYWILFGIFIIYSLFVSIKLFFISIIMLGLSFLIFNLIMIFENNFVIFITNKTFILKYKGIFRGVDKIIINNSNIKYLYYNENICNKIFDLTTLTIKTCCRAYNLNLITNRKDVLNRIKKIIKFKEF